MTLIICKPNKVQSIRGKKNIYLQELDNVASSENAMGDGELERVAGRKIRGQYAFLHAPAPEELASRTWTQNHRRRRLGRWVGMG